MLTGLSRMDAQGSIAMFPFVMQEKRLLGSVYGSGSRRATSRGWCRCIRRGGSSCGELVSRTYTLDKVNDALTALAASDGARGVIRW